MAYDDMGMDYGMDKPMGRRPMGGRGAPGGAVDFGMADNMPMDNPLDMGDQSAPGGGMDFAMGDNPHGGAPPVDDFTMGGADPLGGNIGGDMNRDDSMMMGGLDASSMAGYQETPSFDSAYADMDNDGIDYGPDPMENAHIDMGEAMFDEGGRMEGNTLGDLLSDADSAPEIHSFDINGDMDSPSSMGGDMGMVSDAVSDYKSMGGMEGSMDAGMSKSMEYRGMGQRPMAPMRGGRGRMMY